MSIVTRISHGRLVIRPLEIRDADDLYLYRSNASINCFQGWIPTCIEEVNDFILYRISPEINVPDTWFQFAIVLEKSGELIGDMGLHFLDSHTEAVEVGITIAEEYQRKGYATEALSAIFPILFYTLDKKLVLAEIDAQNVNSIRLFKGLGFLPVVSELRRLVLREEFPDDLVFSLSKSDWQSQISLFS
jgi:RimJ/RimL family protein N-acetyltransferase